MTFRQLAFGLLVIVAGCQRPTTSIPTAESGPGGPPVAPTTVAATATPASAAPTRVPVAPTQATATPSCAYRPLMKIAELQDRKVGEASALVASIRNPDVYWTLNDSGNEPQLFAFDSTGRRLGTYRVENADNEDWEALQIGPGRNGEPALYIGDVGDNDRDRKESIIYRVPEPQVDLVNVKSATLITERAEIFRFNFPHGAVNVEAILVHPVTGETLFIAKENSARPHMFHYPGSLDASKRVTLEDAGQLNLDLGSFGAPLNLVTDASISSDARKVVVRTYTAAIELELPEGVSLAKLSTLKGRAFPLNDPPQGEGISYRADNKAIMTIGERTPAYFYQTEWGCP
jgi:hypothetical protein